MEQRENCVSLESFVKVQTAKVNQNTKNRLQSYLRTAGKETIYDVAVRPTNHKQTNDKPKFF